MFLHGSMNKNTVLGEYWFFLVDTGRILVAVPVRADGLSKLDKIFGGENDIIWVAPRDFDSIQSKI